VFTISINLLYIFCVFVSFASIGVTWPVGCLVSKGLLDMWYELLLSTCTSARENVVKSVEF
jgi:hypothetical protein